jgi:hypothetical protein
MPIIAMIFGKQNFNDLTFTINGAPGGASQRPDVAKARLSCGFSLGSDFVPVFCSGRSR